MTSTVFKAEGFYQVLQRRKRELQAKFDYQSVEILLIKFNRVQKDEFCEIGELLTTMIREKWPYSKCIEVFKVIKKVPEYVDHANSVIEELKQAESSYSCPVPVESNPSEEEEIELQSLSKYVGVPMLSKTIPKLEMLDFESDETITACKIERKKFEECGLFTRINDKYVLKEFSIILEEQLPHAFQNSCMFLKVTCAACINILHGTNNDGLKYDFCKEGEKVTELLKDLVQQTSPIKIKHVMKSVLFPQMNCVSKMVKKLTLQKESWGTFLWKSATFNLIDEDRLRKLRQLRYYEPVLDYLIKLVTFLINCDSKSSYDTGLASLKKVWEDSKNAIIKSMEDYESKMCTDVWNRGLTGSVAYCSLVALGFFAISMIPVALAAGTTLIIGGVTYTYYQACQLPNKLDACKAEGEHLSEQLQKIPADGLKISSDKL